MRTNLNWLAVMGLSILAACGGGGDASGPVIDSASGVISGTVTKGPVANATVTAYAISAGRMAAAVGSATTDTSGNFTLAMGSYAGAVMLRVSGGTYADEATGIAMAMAPGDVMTAVLPAMAAGATLDGIQVTPVTAMAQAMAERMADGMSAANIAAANAAMGNYFSVADILHTHPMNPLVAGAGAGAGQDARNYGMTLAAMSQYAKTLGMPNSSALVTAMMGDAADGVMDGMAGADPISMPMGGMMGGGRMAATAGTSGLAAAMAGFMLSSSNASGLSGADMAALMRKLAASDGHP